MTELTNNPPPEAAIEMAIDDLVAEAVNFLDGEEIANEGQAEALGKLVGDLRQLAKLAEEKRKDEKKPHDEAGNAVQAKWKPIIKKADLAIRTATAPITRYLEKLALAQRQQAERARREAEAAAAKAFELAKQAKPDDLTAAMAKVAAEAKADAAAKIAKRAEKQKAHVAGGARAMALRTSWEPELTNMKEAMAWAVDRRRDQWREGLMALLLDLAEKEIKFGVRAIPGFVIHERKKAV